MLQSIIALIHSLKVSKDSVLAIIMAYYNCVCIRCSSRPEYTQFICVLSQAAWHLDEQCEGRAVTTLQHVVCF